MIKTKVTTGLILAMVSLSSYSNTYQFKHPANGLMKNKTDNYGNDVIVFRHVKHDTEGWADIVIAKVKSPILVNSEATYRSAAINSGFEAYFTRTSESDNFRCRNQIYRPPEVPEIDTGCRGDDSGFNNYILLKKPDYITSMPTHLFRGYDERYWIHGAGRWIMDLGASHELLETGITSYKKALAGIVNGLPTRSLSTGDWIFTVNKKTNKR